MATHKIIVYGTLRKDQEFHHMLGGAPQIGADVLIGYDMFSVDWYPTILPGKGTVSVECYEIDDNLLEIIDRFEGYFGENHSDNEFERQIIDHERWGRCWIYMKLDSLPQNAIPILSGDWKRRDE